MSYVIAGPTRGLGLSGGVSCSQVLPSHSQVSPSPLGPAPPNSTTRPRAQSYAIPGPILAEGLVAVLARVQVLPSHSQVSAAAPLLVRPPNRTVRLRARSKAIPK